MVINQENRKTSADRRETERGKEREGERGGEGGRGRGRGRGRGIGRGRGRGRGRCKGRGRGRGRGRERYGDGERERERQRERERERERQWQRERGKVEERGAGGEGEGGRERELSMPPHPVLSMFICSTSDDHEQKTTEKTSHVTQISALDKVTFVKAMTIFLQFYLIQLSETHYFNHNSVNLGRSSFTSVYKRTHNRMTLSRVEDTQQDDTVTC